MNNNLKFLTEAVVSLLPNVPIHIDGENYENIHTLDGTKIPPKDQVEAKIKELQKEWEDTQYQRDRAPQYPSLADFADAYYWAQKGDNTKMNAYIAQCDEVKNQYPKP